MSVALALIVLSVVRGDESDPISDFRSSAPELFDEWVSHRETSLRSVGLGNKGRILPCKANDSTMNFFEFIQCSDVRAPEDYQVDVVKTDSLVSPIVGVLKVKVTLSCRIRRLVPVKINWNLKNYQEKVSACLGKTYEECLAAGCFPAPKLLGAGCTGGPEGLFTYNGTAMVNYRRVATGKWELESEDSSPPIRE